MENLSIRITDYNPLEKEFLKGFFTLVLDFFGVEMFIYDCKHFKKQDNTWFSLPQKEIKQRPGEKSKYFQLIRFPEASVMKELNDLVLNEINKITGENVGGENNKTRKQETKVQSESQTLPF